MLVYTGIEHYSLERENPSVMNRGLRITAGVILVAVGVAALMFYAFGGKKYESLNHMMPLGNQVREIRVDGGSGSIEIRFVESGDGNNTVRIDGEASPAVAKRIGSAEVRDGVLHLDFREDRRFDWFFHGVRGWNEEMSITFSLTDDAMAALDAFRAGADSGMLTVDGVAARESVFESDSGSIRIDNLTGGAATVKSDSGSIRLGRFEGGSLTLQSDSGSIMAETVRAGLKAESDTGSIRINRLTGAGEIRTDSGSIRVVKADDTGLDAVSDSGSVHITVPASYGGGYDLASDTGSIRHPEPAGASNEVIRVRTDSGSILIEQ